MPSEQGGRSDKEGNRYEIKYSIFKILEVLEEKIDYVILEAIGDDEQGIDVWVGEKDGIKEGQQCKIRNGSNDSWDFSSANSKNLFTNWKIQLDRDSNNCVALVTPLAFQNLEDLLKRVKNSNENPEDFYKYQIQKSSLKFRNFFSNYCKVMDLNVDEMIDIQKSIYYLKRTKFHQIPDSYLKEIVLTKIAYLFSDNANDIYSSFITWIIDGDILGKTININVIHQFIEKNHLQLKNLSLDSRVLPRIKQLNKEYRKYFQPLNSSLIERKEFKNGYDLIDKSKSLIIHGKAGIGKSGFTESLINHCEISKIAYLAIKLDSRVPNQSARRWGEELGLPDSIANCLHSISKNEKAVLILDQLDALRWTLAHSRNSLLVCSEIIQQVNILNQERDKKISIVMVCRTIDLESDNNIRSLIEENQSKAIPKWERIKIDELENTEVQKVVGDKYQSLTPKLKTLLKIPSNLFIWCQLDKNKLYDECLSTNHLIEKWWNQLSINYTNRGHASKELNEFKKELINKFLELERMYVPKKFFEGNKNEIDYLFSNDFITLSDNKIFFSHQSVLDFLLSEKMLERYFSGISIYKILGDKSLQTPGKRYQLQMLLQMLLDIDSADFINVGKQLLESKEIRFFNKYAFLEIVRDIDLLDKNISNFILSYCNNEEWRDHLFNNVIYSKIQYYKLLLNNGVINKWLEDDTHKDYAISLISSISPFYDLIDINFIEKYIFLSEEHSKKFSKCFPYDFSKDTDEMFNLRLKLYTKYPELNHCYISLSSDIKKNENRTIRYLEFLMINKLKNKSNYFDEIENRIFIEDNNFTIKNGEWVYKTLIKFVPLEKRIVHEFSEWSGKNYKDSFERSLIKILKKSIKSMVKNNPIRFQKVISELFEYSNDVINELILEGLLFLDDHFSDFSIKFICENFNERIFIRSIGDGDELSLVKKILEKHALNCSGLAFSNLENTILYYVPENAKDYLQRRIEYNKENNNERVYWSYWGDLQLELLSILPSVRLSHKSLDLLKVLKRKFDGVKNTTRYRYYLGGSGFIKSPVNKKRLSSKSWLEIITKQREDFKENESWRKVEGGIIESSIEQFAISFADAVKNNPLELTKLVLHHKNYVSDYFINALYSGLSNSELKNVPICTLEEVFRELPVDLKSNRAQYFCEIIEKSPYTIWSSKTLNILMHIATKHYSPSIEKPVITSENDAEMKSFEMIYVNSLNCARGCAARTIEHLLWKNPDYYLVFRSTIIELTNDLSSAVKLSSIFTLRALINVDREWALTKILDLYSNDFRLAGHVKLKDTFFLAYDLNRELILKIIFECFKSSDEALVKIGSELIAEMYLIKNEFIDIVDEFTIFSNVQINAFLEIIVLYFNQDTYNEHCKKVLVKFFELNHNTESVFSRLFYDNLIDLNRDYSFLIILMKSKKSKRILFSFMEYLQKRSKSIVEFSVVILELSKNVIDNFDRNKNDSWQIAQELPKLIIGLYDETFNSECLNLHKIALESIDLWDKMFELRIGSIRELSKEIMVR